MQSSISSFEDLSNELLYEIFDYLDYADLFETFASLNHRFHYLIVHSSLPIKLKFSFLSKATFEYQCQQILLPNMHRIISIYLSQQLPIEYFATYHPLDSSYIRLEVLTLDQFKWDTLLLVLPTLTALPRLFSLTLLSMDQYQPRTTIYSSILRLTALKYCKLSWNTSSSYSSSSSFDTVEVSPLEHLILDTKCHLDDIIEILNHTPHLRRLSCQLSTSNSSLSEIFIVPENLTHISLQFEDASFDEFEWFISSFVHQLQILQISAKHDLEFLNAARWQRLISERMPCLQRFLFEYRTRENLTDERYHELIGKFKSSFWIDRQWYFTHQHYRTRDFQNWIRLYSTRPYRWKQYQLLDDVCQYDETGVNFAEEVDLHRYGNTDIRFPRTNQLIFSEGNLSDASLFISNLTNLFLPAQLTELVIFDEQLRFEHLLSLIHHFPNIQYLTIHTSILNFSSPQSSTTRLQIPINNLIRVTVFNRCTLEDIQILHRLCPYWQSLEIEVEKDLLESAVNFLLLRNSKRTFQNQFLARPSPDNLPFWKPEYSTCLRCQKSRQIHSSHTPCNHHLSSLCFREVNYRMIRKIQTMIDDILQLEDVSIQYNDQKLYLWW